MPRAPNSLFTGQQDILADIEDCLLRDELSEAEDHMSKQYVLRGIGGVGKSEIALQFARLHRQEYWGIFWIDCSTLESAQRSFGLISRRCSWEGDSNAVVLELSNSNLPWLLVLDNCDDPEVDYSQFIPDSQKGALLITTRLEDVRTHYGRSGSQIVQGLSESYAVELLLKAAGKPIPGSNTERSAAKSIVKQLGMHTLPITVAASLIKRT